MGDLGGGILRDEGGLCMRLYICMYVGMGVEVCMCIAIASLEP